MTNEKILSLLRAECKKAGTQAKWAAAHGLSAAYLSDVLQGRREIGDRILQGLGYRRVVSYKRIATSNRARAAQAKESDDGE